MKILYVFTGGRRNRLESLEEGMSVPRELLLGAPELRDMGHHVDIMEFAELAPAKKTVRLWLREKLNVYKARFFSINSCSHLLDENKVRKFDNYELVIAGNEYVAFGLADLQKNGLFHAPISFFVMGMLAKIDILRQKHSVISSIQYFLAKKIYGRLLCHSFKAIFLGKGEFDFANDIFNNCREKLEFLPFPVDNDFWSHGGDVAKNEEYVLFIGNDLRRNYTLLIDIVKALPNINFLFVTRRLQNYKLPVNVKLMQGDWRSQLLSDDEIRTLIRNCSLVILPLTDSLQPSGQSVCQQAMACGKPVIISSTRGFWDPANLHNEKHLTFVDKNDVATWTKRISQALEDKEFCQRISCAALIAMKNYFGMSDFGKGLEKLFLKKGIRR